MRSLFSPSYPSSARLLKPGLLLISLLCGLLLSTGVAAVPGLPGVDDGILPAKPEPAAGKAKPQKAKLKEEDDEDEPDTKPAKPAKPKPAKAPATEARPTPQPQPKPQPAPTKPQPSPQPAPLPPVKPPLKEPAAVKETPRPPQAAREPQAFPPALTLPTVSPSTPSTPPRPPAPPVSMAPPAPPRVEDISGWNTQSVKDLQRRTAQYYGLPVFGKPCDLCPEEAVIPAGIFAMGSNRDEPGHYEDESPIRKVMIGHAFAMSRTEVTQRLWRDVMGYNPSRFNRCGDDCPVEMLTWDEARRFTEQLSRRSGKRYRLATEAEWEYAARAGTTTPFYTGWCLDSSQANFDGASDNDYHCNPKLGEARNSTVRVASFAPNPFGLYDMIGNVGEWVLDRYFGDTRSAPPEGSPRRMCSANESCVLKGGYWEVTARYVRAANRQGLSANYKADYTGLRVVRDLP